MELTDYREKLQFASDILLRITHHSCEFPDFVEHSIWGDRNTSSADDGHNSEVETFIRKESQCEEATYCLPNKNQRNTYFKTGRYIRQDCRIYPIEWLQALNLNECIYYGREADNSCNTRCIYPFKTSIKLCEELMKLYKLYSKEYDLSRLPLPTTKLITVRGIPEIIDDMITHCQQGKMLIDSELIAPKVQPSILVTTDSFDTPPAKQTPQNKDLKIPTRKGLALNAVLKSFFKKGTKQATIDSPLGRYNKNNNLPIETWKVPQPRTKPITICDPDTFIPWFAKQYKTLGFQRHLKDNNIDHSQTKIINQLEKLIQKY